MGTAHRIERERLEKRARILDAARELFVERGVDAVTLREIAQRIEYSTTAIYVQFKDKAALVEAMVSEDFAQFASSLEVTARIRDPLARLRALHAAYVEFALSMPRHYQLLFMTPPVQAVDDRHDHAKGPAGIDGYRVLLATVAECIAADLFRPEVVDADLVAQTVWANVHGFVSLQIVMGQHAEFRWRSREELSGASGEMALRALLRSPALLGGSPEATSPAKTRKKR